VEKDIVDEAIEEWQRERSDLDATPLGVVSRILVLAQQLEKSANRALERHGIELWQFDVLAALRRSGAPYRLSPTQLSDSVFLTSGAMTNRLDRLESDGLVVRLRDPDDRRGVLIQLTPRGRKLVDEAVETRLSDAEAAVSSLHRSESRVLAKLLRRLIVAQDGQGRTNGERRRTTRLTAWPSVAPVHVRGPAAARARLRPRSD
jgi:DNA-binding MarR family transcriptional regulator